MQNLSKISFLIIAGVFFLSPSSFAAMLSGKVVSTDTGTRKVTLSTVNASTGQPVQSDIWIDASASLEGLAQLSDIKPGDTLWLEAEADSEGNLRAAKVTKG